MIFAERGWLGTGLPSEIGLCDEGNSTSCNTGSDSQGSSRSQDICSDKGDENYQCQEEEISIFNKSLLLGESPLEKRKLQTLKSYFPEKKKKLKKLVKGSKSFYHLIQMLLPLILQRMMNTKQLK